jgi:UDP-glucose 4-epimerase
MKILILGGSGFIGKNLCRFYARKNVQIVCFSADNPFDDGFLIEDRHQIEWVQGQFNDIDTLKRLLPGCVAIFHLICTTLPATSNKDLMFDLTSNILPTLNLLEAVKETRLQKLIFVSSGGTVYGLPQGAPIPESHDTQPICGYGIHKLAIEKYLHLYHHLHGLEYGILRLSNPYGKNQISDRPQGVIGNFLHKALNRQPLDVWGDGTVVRDYIYIDDAIEAFDKLLNYSGSHRLFNIGSGIGHSILDIICEIQEILGYKLDVRFHQARDVDVPLNVLDIHQARNVLQWQPKTDLKTGLQYLAEHARGHLIN